MTMTAQGIDLLPMAPPLPVATGVKEAPHKRTDAGCDQWGPQRLHLAKVLKPILDSFAAENSAPWFIESGTLMGAWRNTRFIPHDDDFDVGILCSSDNMETVDALLGSLQDYIEREFGALQLDEYKVRRVTQYCHKLEIYEPALGSYTLLGESYLGCDFHYNTVDVHVYAQIRCAN